MNQSLNEQLDELTDRYYTTAGTQTDTPDRRNVLTNTSAQCKVDAQSQTEKCIATSAKSDKQEEDATPSQALSSRVELEDHSKSIPVHGIVSPKEF